jgi:hypothetical protein
MNRCMITLVCIMAIVTEDNTGGIKSTLENDVMLTFCYTGASQDGKVIVTTQMSGFGDAGYFPIAVVQIDPDDLSQFALRALNGLSDDLQFALEHKGCDLIRSTLSSLADHYAFH